MRWRRFAGGNLDEEIQTQLAGMLAGMVSHGPITVISIWYYGLNYGRITAAV